MAFNTAPGGGTFGDDADLYDAARPDYPSELFDWLRDACSLGPQSDCFEIGAGAGHATLPVLALPVRSVLAIEPDEQLARRLADKAGADPRLSHIRSTFEDADLQPASFDFGFAATSFHWLQRMKALARIRAALKPGGRFAMWWSVYDDPVAPDAFSQAVSRLSPSLEQAPGRQPRIAFGLDVNSRLGEMRAAGFEDVRHRLFTREVTFTPQSAAALCATLSRVRMSPPDARARLLAGVESIVREAFGGMVTRTIPTSAFLGRTPA